MKRLLSALAAILVTSLAAYAATLPLFNTTPFYMVSAGATWTNSSTTITLASTTPCPAALQAGSAVTDTSSSQAYIIGYVQSCPAGTTTLTLVSAAQFASVSSADVLRISNDVARYQEPNQLLATLNYLISLINGSSFQASTQAITNTRNVLDNGSMIIQGRGTGAATCATTGAVVSANYSADRWLCDVNVGSGVGTMQVTTSSPTPPTPFTAQEAVVRASGVLTQPICAFQEVPAGDVYGLQGQNVTFSFYAASLAGLNADNGNVVNAYIMYGTTADQGFGSWTASTAITPAWAGINSAITSAITLPTTNVYARYTLTGVIPTTAKEIGVAICFTPTAAGAGSTDGFVFTGAQLEGGSAASAYEWKSYNAEIRNAQRYFYRVTDSITGSTYTYALGQATTTSAAIFVVPFPVTMRATPTGSVSATTAFADTATAGSPTNCTAFAIVSSAATPYAGEVTCTAGATTTAGGASQLVGASTATNAYMQWSADF